MESFDVTVVGSCMIDLVCNAPRLPKSGETLHGTKFFVGHGGKGANQCVAAAKLGARCSLIARLGDDSFGKDYQKALKDLEINVRNVILTPSVSSGMAQITVAETGENHIVIIAGANNRLCNEDVVKAEVDLLNSKVAIFQFETPLETTVFALKLIKEKGGPFTIVNGAPAVENVIPDLYQLCDVFCVNETEAESISGQIVTDIETAFIALEKLLSFGCKTVIITLGSKGAVFGNNVERNQHIPVKATKSVDTTGAGDAFVGALGYFTAKFVDLPLPERIQRACLVASESVLHEGTQSSFPYKSELPEDLFGNGVYKNVNI